MNICLVFYANLFVWFGCPALSVVNALASHQRDSMFTPRHWHERWIIIPSWTGEFFLWIARFLSTVTWAREISDKFCNLYYKCKMNKVFIFSVWKRQTCKHDSSTHQPTLPPMYREWRTIVVSKASIHCSLSSASRAVNIEFRLGAHWAKCHKHS